MKIKVNYLAIPLVVLAAALLGSFFTGQGMNWYDSLTLPKIAPAGSLIGAAWTIIYVLGTASALLVWNKVYVKKIPFKILALFSSNAILNAAWTLIFFTWHQIGWSIIEMLVLNLTTLALIIIFWKKFKIVSALLIPYFIWVSFATYLAYQIWRLN
ncbi:MAG TPA: TspO/MBR family protein [Candidatus Bipolaricaulota bacterium]|nr:TspO/MBR family protein [Candidatus Bipolaricaulota bacterium]